MKILRKMEIKITSIILLIAFVFFGQVSPEKKECCPTNTYKNDKLMEKAEIYLKELKKKNKDGFQNAIHEIDSLKNRKLLNKKVVKKEFKIIRDTLRVYDTLYIIEKRNFWGKTKIDTINFK
jgi:hypothetical protein